MKKYILILIPFIFWGCQKDFNTVVDPKTEQNQVASISTASIFQYTGSDSLITISIKFNGQSSIASVSCDIIAPNNSTLNTTPVILYDNGNLSVNGDSVSGDNEFSNKFPMSQSYADGTYDIQFYVTDKSGNTNTVAKHFFTFNNGLNYPSPVISNLIAPDTVTINPLDTTFIDISVQVHDDAGLGDIAYVFFNSYVPPNGAASHSNPILMFDDGKSVHGDSQAGDGIYSQVVSLPPTGVPKGIFRWEFQAQNNSSKLSNTIIHYIVVK